jgi:quercetin dioxygenase-like cupin family protein
MSVYVRIFTGPDGLSHFEDLDLPFESPAGRGTTPPQASAGVFFNRSPAGQDSGWHTAPRRQYVIGIQGVTQITLRNGDFRRFGPGDIILAEDVTGSGHHTKVYGDEERVSLMIPLGD